MTTTKKTIDRQRRRNRIRAKIHGTTEKPRLTVFKSLDYHYAQLVDDTQGKTLASASDIADKKSKDNKTARAHKVGLKLAELAKEKKILGCVFDRNGYRYHGRVKALADGAREGGLKF